MIKSQILHIPPPVISPDAKIFWLKFQRKLETLNEQPAQSKTLFPLGEIYLTIGAREALAESNQIPNEFLPRHQTSDYGDICESDKRENELSVKEVFEFCHLTEP